MNEAIRHWHPFNYLHFIFHSKHILSQIGESLQVHFRLLFDFICADSEERRFRGRVKQKQTQNVKEKNFQVLFQF
jgi:hypothetical protein